MTWVSTVAAGLAFALLFGLLARRIGLSPIVGYLIAGVVVGPHTPGLVGNAQLVAQIADVGVILLMFGVGLGFSLRDLRAVRGIAVPGALIGSSVAVTCGALLGISAGFGTAEAFVFGACFVSASTVVIMRGMIELDLLGSIAGRIAVGWSVVEDLIIVLVLVLLSAVGDPAGGGSLVADLFETFGKVALLGVVVFVIGPVVVLRMLRVVARLRSRELFTLSVLVVAIGIAYLSSEFFGVSLALGAFLAGMVVGQSDLSHQAAADALPLRDAFAVLFFVGVGMLFDPSFVLARPGLVAASLAVVLIAKPATALLVLLARGYPLKQALAVAAGLAQVSEFAFVLAGAAVGLGLMSADARNAVLAAVLLSITLSPLMFRATGPMERWLSRRALLTRFIASRAGRLASLPSSDDAAIADHAVLCGYGRVGKVLGTLLRERGIPLVVIEQDRLLVEQLRREGTLALFGDAGSHVLLDSARIAAARALVVTVPDPVTARLAIEHASSVNPRIGSVVRVHHDTVLQDLNGLPRTHCVLGEVELAFGMARAMLERFDISAIEAEATVIDLRRGRTGRAAAPTRIAEIHVPASSPAVGRRIADLGLAPGTLIMTIARGGEFVVPGGGTELAAGDALLVLADAAAVRQFDRILSG